ETLINKKKEEEAPELDQKDIEKVTNATAKVGTAVTTTAAVVTTAVVAVVGVDLATHELINEPVPTICQIVEVIPTTNTISFSIKIGDTASESLSEETGKECELIVELTCDYYETQSIEIHNYGYQSYTFDNLAEDTEYTIDVVQYSLLEFRKSVLSDGEKAEEPTSIKTLPGERYTNSISLDIEVNPLGTDYYYSTIEYKNTLGINLFNYCVEVFNEDPEHNGEMMAWANLNSDDPFSRQRLEWSNFSGIDSEPYFALVATTDDQNYISTHQGNNTSGRPEDEMEIILFSQRINIENLDRPELPITENRIFAQRIWSEENSVNYYRFYFATPEPEGTYEQLIVSITNTRDSSTVSSSMHTAGTTKTMNTPLDFDLNFGSSGEYETFNISVRGLSHRQEDVDQWNADNPNPASGPATTDGGVDVTICSETINFDKIETIIDQYEPVINNVSFLEVATFENPSRLGIIIDKTDPGYHLQSYSILINDYEYNIASDEYTDDYYIVEGAEDLIGSSDVMNYTLYGMSDYGMSYNRAQKVELYDGEDDFSEMEPTYIQGCADLRYINGGDQYYLSFSIYYEGSESFNYFVLYICDLDGNVIVEGEGDDAVEYQFTQNATDSDATTTVPQLQGNYIIRTCGYNYYEQTLYTEIVDFGNIELSV
ncbi:MAG: hypothetical protein J5511_05240, partial [Bacilli bacterium]|nr:hypothetical protein [Bacilli bacterium]